MKSKIICGVPLAGKSTLSNHLHTNWKYNHIPLDSLVTAFENIYPNLQITHQIWLSMNTYDIVCSRLTNFVREMIIECEEQNIFGSYILEWCHVSLEDIHMYKETHDVYVIWYPHISVQEKFDIVRTYDADNWTNSCSNKELKEIIAFWIEVSKKHYTQAKELWYIYIDSGTSFENIYSI